MADPNRVPSNLTNATDSGATRKAGGLEPRAYQELKIGIHRYLLNRLDLERIASAPDERTRAQALAVIRDAVSRLKGPFNDSEKEHLSQEILDEMFGLGPIEPLLQDPTVSDMLVNGAKEV